MSVCRKMVTRTQYVRDDSGNYTGETKEVDAPGFSYPCDLGLEEGHPGPCSSTSYLNSVHRRAKWVEDDKRRQAEARHAASPLSRVQSLPQTVGSMVERDSLLEHPSQPKACPYCDESPMVKEWDDHITAHSVARLNQALREGAESGTVRSRRNVSRPSSASEGPRSSSAAPKPFTPPPPPVWPPEPSRGAGNHFWKAPSHLASSADDSSGDDFSDGWFTADVIVLQDWVQNISSVVYVPDQVMEALNRLSAF